MIYVAVDEIPMCIRVYVCVCIYASGRGQMHDERKVKHNDVSFNASVVIFYLRTTRDNGRPAYEYRAKTVVSLCHTRARVLMKFTLFWRTPVCTQMRLCTAHTRVLYKRERERERTSARIGDTTLTFHPAAVSFGDDVTAP